jgi:predicted nucleic acid-binding protein
MGQRRAVSGYFFDSNILIDALGTVAQARHELSRARSGSISRLSWIEIMAAAPAAARTQTELFLRRFQTIEISEDIARRAALLCGQHRRLRLPDAIVWASAQATNMILVTRNTRDFPANMLGIRVPYTL